MGEIEDLIGQLSQTDVSSLVANPAVEDVNDLPVESMLLVHARQDMPEMIQQSSDAEILEFLAEVANIKRASSLQG